MSFKFPVENFPASTNPQPNVFPADLAHREIADLPPMPQCLLDRQIRRTVVAVLDNFWLDMGICCASAVNQCAFDGDHTVAYAEKAWMNRARVEQLQRIESEQKKLRRRSTEYDIGSVA